MTQFEAATAATFVALAAARVKAAAIEAGLGGRLDATNTIPSRVTVLTSIGLDHTEWLGETELEIAAEKLAVLRDQTTLVLGRVSRRGRGAGRADRGRARGPPAAARPRTPAPEVRAAAPRAASSAATSPSPTTAAEAFLGELDPEPVARGGGQRRRARPARADRRASRRPTSTPPTTPTAPPPSPRRCRRSPAGRRGRRLPRRSSPTRTPRRWSRRWRRPSTRAVCTELPAAALDAHGRPGARSRPAAELAALCERGRAWRPRPSPTSTRRCARARELAAEPPEGALLVTGSHYALAPARAALRA